MSPLFPPALVATLADSVVACRVTVLPLFALGLPPGPALTLGAILAGAPLLRSGLRRAVLARSGLRPTDGA